MSNVALIDADELSYKIALQYQQKFYTILRDDKVLWKCRYKEEAVESIENETDLDIGETIEVFDLKGYKDTIDAVISSICDNTNSSSSKLCLSGSNNFRYSLATIMPYKGNRPATKPYHLETIKNEFRDRGAESVDFLEADDLLSIYSTKINNSIICTTDKDLSTVPSINYNIFHKDIKVISEDTANYNFYYQLLIGDTVDNIPSPYGLGKETSKSFLTDFMHLSGTNIGTPDWYRNHFIPFYLKHLLKKDKSNNFKTKWYKPDMSVENILLEIGNLLWMRRTLDPNERWDPVG